MLWNGFIVLRNKLVSSINKNRLISFEANIKRCSLILSKMSQEVIDIDGGIMEGGGQILRMAAAFSALLKKPVHVRNIRAGRNKPGLRPQHLAGLQLVRDICDGKLEGGSIESTEVTFYPTSIQSGKFNADPGTAGSIMLLFQVSLPCLLFVESPTQLYLKGGTNAEMAPQIDYTLMVFQPIAERFGVKFGCDIIKRGYYPKGGGEVVIKTSPTSGLLTPVELLDPGNVVNVKGRAFVAGVLPIKMAHGMADAAVKVLRESFPDVPLTIDRIKEPPHAAFGNGSGIIIVAETSTGCLFGGAALGKRGMLAEDVGYVAANDLVEDISSGGCVDRHLQDQLIMFMALANGKSRIRCGSVTLHTETAIYIAELLSKAKFNIVKDQSTNTCIIECQGIGLSR